MAANKRMSTGQVLEAMVLPALENGGYKYETQKEVGKRPGGGRHMADVIANKDGRDFLISVKWQQVSGTAEQKVPYEVMSLVDANKDEGYSGVYLVLGGGGWKLRDFYLSKEFKSYLRHGDKVEIVTLEQFVALANRGKL